MFCLTHGIALVCIKCFGICMYAFSLNYYSMITLNLAIPYHQPTVLYMILRELLLLPVPALHQTGRQVPATGRGGTGQTWASLGGICFQDTM